MRRRRFSVRPRACAALWIAIASGLLLAPASAGQGGGAARAPAREAVEIELSGTIDPATADWVDDALGDAVDDGAALAIVRLDTPGGLDTSMRAIVRAIVAAPLPVVVYVAPGGARAASAGMFVTLAADVAAMAPQTNIGAATPVSLTGGDTEEVLGRKVRNDAAAYARALAEAHGRNGDLAVSMVRDATSVTAREARRRGLVDVVAPDTRALLARLDGFAVQGPKAQTLRTAGLAVTERAMPFAVQARQLLVNPSIAYVLLVGGLLLIGFELLSPGLVGPGVFGAIMLLLGLYGTAQLPVTVGGVLLLALGLGLLAAETQVASGALGVAGALALVVGGLLLFDTESEVVRVTVPAAVATGALLAGLILFAGRKAVSLRRRPARGDAAELVGRVAEVRVPLDPVGQVYVDGALWRARRDGPGPPLPRGARVVVARVAGLTLHVRRRDADAGATAPDGGPAAGPTDKEGAP